METTDRRTETTMGGYSEEQLVAEATEVLGGGEPVLAAGVFGLADLVFAAMAGSAAGGAVGRSAGDGAADVAGAVVSGVLGGIAAKRAYAASQGASLQLIVAVTGEQIHVLNRDADGQRPDVLASIPRATCEVTVKKMGLSRTVELRHTETDEVLRLTGTTMPLSPLAKGDKVVLELLSA